MKLREAIEIIGKITYGDRVVIKYDIDCALQLLIEAGKREEKRRRFAVPDKVDLLPGETKE